MVDGQILAGYVHVSSLMGSWNELNQIYDETMISIYSSFLTKVIPLVTKFDLSLAGEPLPMQKHLNQVPSSIAPMHLQ